MAFAMNLCPHRRQWAGPDDRPFSRVFENKPVCEGAGRLHSAHQIPESEADIDIECCHCKSRAKINGILKIGGNPGMHGIGIKAVQGQRNLTGCCFQEAADVFQGSSTALVVRFLSHLMGNGQNISKPWVHQWFTFDMKTNIVGKRCCLCSNFSQNSSTDIILAGRSLVGQNCS